MLIYNTLGRKKEEFVPVHAGKANMLGVVSSGGQDLREPSLGRTFAWEEDAPDMLIIHAVSGGNINRRNYARSYFCVYVLAIVLVIVLSIAGIDWAGLAQGVGTPA